MQAFIADTKSRNALSEWRRGQAVWLYLHGHRAVEIAAQLNAGRSTVTLWLKWFDQEGVAGLHTAKRPGAPPRLSQAQRDELATIIEAGPIAVGFRSGVWVAAMVGEVIWQRFGVRYHWHHVPKVLHAMGFSVQRPRKRLSRADADKQAVWLRERLPAIKKKRVPAEGWCSSRTKRVSG